MPNLDAYTLATVSSLAGLFMAITMAGIYLAGNRESAIVYWALAGLLFSIGHVFASLAMAGTEFVPTRVTIAVANTTITLGYGMVLVGIQSHLGRRRAIGPILAVAALVLAGGLFWPVMYANTGMRVGLIAVLYLLIALISAALLWRESNRMLAPYRKAVALIIVGNALAMLIRGLFIMAGFGQSAGSGGVNVMVPAFLSSMIFYMALNVSLALILFRRKEEHLRYMARHDALTGLLNRYSLDDFAAREVARAKRGHNHLSLAVLDLDDFKQVNDRHGHAAGDQVLVEVARRIHDVIREADLAFRVGGEEFLILLPDADRDVASRVAERLRLNLVGQSFDCLGETMKVSASVGVVMLDPARDDWESLLRRADLALYRAKRKGRNRVEVAAESPFDDSESASGID